ncbi:MAG: Fe-S oxidoreductase [Microbacterium sp.]
MWGWVTYAGYLYGCAVGWVWGGLLSRGRVERHGRLWVFRGMPAWSFRRGGTCVGNCFLTGDGRIDARLLRHEAVHERQWRRHGILMPFLYALAGSDPLRNRFEIEAGLEDGNYLPRPAGPAL